MVGSRVHWVRLQSPRGSLTWLSGDFLAYGFTFGDLNLKRLAMFLLVWLVGRTGLPYAPYEPARAMFSPFVAVLDIALVFTIFKGDVRLT